MSKVVMINGQTWEGLSVGHKLSVVWGQVEVVEYYLLREDKNLLGLLIEGATLEEAVEYVNENY